MHFIQVLSGCFCTLLSYNLKFRFFHSLSFEIFYIFSVFLYTFLFILYIIIYYAVLLIQQKCSLFFQTNAQLPKYIPQSFATVRESFPKSSNKIICHISIMPHINLKMRDLYFLLTQSIYKFIIEGVF